MMKRLFKKFRKEEEEVIDVTGLTLPKPVVKQDTKKPLEIGTQKMQSTSTAVIKKNHMTDIVKAERKTYIIPIMKSSTYIKTGGNVLVIQYDESSESKLGEVHNAIMKYTKNSLKKFNRITYDAYRYGDTYGAVSWNIEAEHLKWAQVVYEKLTPGTFLTPMTEKLGGDNVIVIKLFVSEKLDLQLPTLDEVVKMGGDSYERIDCPG